MAKSRHNNKNRKKRVRTWKDKKKSAINGSLLRYIDFNDPFKNHKLSCLKK